MTEKIRHSCDNWMRCNNLDADWHIELVNGEDFFYCQECLDTFGSDYNKSTKYFYIGV